MIPQRNSYQALLITDGLSQSYAVFIYQCDLIEWSGIEPVFARIGITDGDGHSWLHNSSGLNDSAMIDCTNGPGSNFNILLDLNTFQPAVGQAPVASSSIVTSSSMQMTTSSSMFSQSQVVSMVSHAVI